ncbi:MAG: NAD-dependent epimerase/dehydratase family protein [Bacteroidales bacterium]
MKYFLTGGTGFIGGVIARKLREQDHEVIAIARRPEKADELRSLGVEVVKGDVTEKESMRSAMQGCDGVYHVAGWYKVGAKDKSPGMKVNVEGTRNVLELMKELEIPKGVYTSTLAINSDTRGKIVDESYLFTGNHISEYDRTKAGAHHIAEEFIRNGLPLIIVMPGMVYGPNGTSVSDKSFRQYLKKKLPVIPKKAAYSWAHVDDIAEAHLLAMEKACPGSTYIISGPSHTLTEAFDFAHEITGIRKPLKVPPVMLKTTAFFTGILNHIFAIPDMYMPETLKSSAGVTYLGDNTKARKELGYETRPLKKGLRETLLYEMEQMKS